MSEVHGLLPDRSRTALLVLDMISDFRFPDGKGVLRNALRIAPRIAALKQRCRKAGFACIYVNDNPGRWQSDSSRLIADCLKPDSPGAPVVSVLRPDETDYFILKPRHSAFYATPLEVLLQHLGTKRLILTGVSAHQCVLFTANDAHLRNMELVVPRDCIAGSVAQETRFAIQYFSRVLRAALPDSRRFNPRTAKRGS